MTDHKDRWDQFRNARPHIKDKMMRVPERFLTQAWSDLDGNDQVYAVMDWVDSWEDGVPAKGLLLMGNPGGGKTTLATLALLDVGHVYRRQSLWLACADWLVRARNFMDMPKHTEAWEDEDIYLKDLETDWIRCLLLDDLGHEHRTSSGWAASEVERLIRKRYYDNAPTIITTNLDFVEIKAKYSASLESFMHEAFIPLTVPTSDRRK